MWKQTIGSWETKTFEADTVENVQMLGDEENTKPREVDDSLEKTIINEEEIRNQSRVVVDVIK